MYCRDCKYNLRGLTEPRCPECGREFSRTDPESYLHNLDPRPWHRQAAIIGAGMILSLPVLLFAGALISARLYIGISRFAIRPLFLAGLLLELCVLIHGAFQLVRHRGRDFPNRDGILIGIYISLTLLFWCGGIPAVFWLLRRHYGLAGAS